MTQATLLIPHLDLGELGKLLAIMKQCYACNTLHLDASIEDIAQIQQGFKHQAV